MAKAYMEEKDITPGIYRHYMGKLYTCLGLAIQFSETEPAKDIMVVLVGTDGVMKFIERGKFMGHVKEPDSFISIGGMDSRQVGEWVPRFERMKE